MIVVLIVHNNHLNDNAILSVITTKDLHFAVFVFVFAVDIGMYIIH